MNRIHRAPHDSGQNEAERSSTAIGEALVDGRALHVGILSTNRSH